MNNMTHYTLPLADPTAVNLDVTGGKGASLAKLATAVLPVPDGFHVTTAAYNHFVAYNDLQPVIMNALTDVDAAHPDTLSAAEDSIRRLFCEGNIPAKLSAAIAQAYQRLPGTAPTVAVRSSATAEDLPEASFAGQQETFLNVKGVTAVLDAVRMCWASLWTARAISYRMRQGIAPEEVSLAVVVQLLVQADVAGILFTANPVNGRRHEAVISAAWGLGEAVVGGLVTPDNITVDKEKMVVVARETAVKELMTVCVNGGTIEQPVPTELQDAPVISDETAVHLTQLGKKIEDLYGQPMDIEWTLADGELAIVQARPITALPEPEAEPISEWPMPSGKGQYLRGSAAELLPDPMCPLFETMGIEALDLGTRQLFGYIAGLPLAEVNSVIYSINGYAYLSAKFSKKQWFLMTTRGLVYIFRLIKNGERHWRELHLKYAAALEQWQAQPVTDMSAADLLMGVRNLTRFGMETYNSLQSGVIPASTTSETLFTKLYEKLIRREGDPSALTFILGFNSMPIRAEKSLYDLGAWAAEQEELVNYLRHTPASQVSADLAETQPSASIPAEMWSEWHARCHSHLAQYGHTVYDLDFLKPTPTNDPTPLLETLKVYIGGQGSNPHERQAALADKREAAMAAVRAQYRRGVRRWLFEKTVGWAQTAIPLREEGLADLGLGWPRLRQMLLEIGRRGVEAGFLNQPDDIFWLEEAEVKTAVTALDRGENLDSMAEIIAERKALWRARKRVIPPSILPPQSKYLGIDVEKWMPARVDQADAHQISGVGASPGRITGTARVLHGPEDFGQMQPGDILVAAITTPAWTPLFALATAVVTDIGGPLSHSSIVAREYGIPAVLGTGVATKRILSGQTITVDGAEGLVLLANGNTEN